MISTVFDTETTGVHTKEDPSDPKTAHPVQLYAAMYEHEDEDYFDTDPVTGQKVFLLPPIQEISVILQLDDGQSIDPKAEAVHHISADRSRKLGVTKDFAMEIFADFCDVSDRLVAHNIAFDKKIVRRALHLAKIDTKIIDKPMEVCTMQYLKPLMKMTPRVYGDWKMPKLIEAYQYLFQRDFEGNAHDAAVDSKACADIYFEIMNMVRNKDPK